MFGLDVVDVSLLEVDTALLLGLATVCVCVSVPETKKKKTAKCDSTYRHQHPR
jgi:hypothetical protein